MASRDGNMTLFHLADSVTVTSANPVKVVNVAQMLGTGPTNRLANISFQCEVNGAATCTAAFQWVGSFDSPNNLAPNGVGGAWSNIGTVQTITCTTPGIAPAVAVLTSTIPYHRYGVIISTVSGSGVQASAVMDA
jgi:hypothetical protein